jgi:hypothetical protein
MTRTIALAGTPLELVERGQGRPLGAQNRGVTKK